MKKAVPSIAYGLAVLSVFFMFFSFIFTGALARLIAATGMHPTAWYSGGDEAYGADRKDYLLTVNHPVFRRVYGESREGFVQIRLRGTPLLPETITDRVEVDGYSFGFTCSTKEPRAQLAGTDGYTKDVQWAYQFSDKSIAIRFTVKNRK
jgi:hypothetical protein